MLVVGGLVLILRRRRNKKVVNKDEKENKDEPVKEYKVNSCFSTIAVATCRSQLKNGKPVAALNIYNFPSNMSLKFRFA